MRLQRLALLFVLWTCITGCLPMTQACEDYQLLRVRNGESATQYARALPPERLVAAYECGVTQVRPSDTSTSRFFAGNEKAIGGILVNRISSLKPQDDLFYLVVGLSEVSRTSERRAFPFNLSEMCRKKYGSGSDCESIARQIETRSR